MSATTYLQGLTWFYEPDRARVVVAGRDGARYQCAAFPMPLLEPPQEPHGKPIFPKEVRGETVYSESAFRYLLDCFGPELANRVSKGRRETFGHRIQALAALYEPCS